jgi:hypothetical protein
LLPRHCYDGTISSVVGTRLMREKNARAMPWKRPRNAETAPAQRREKNIDETFDKARHWWYH